MIAEKECGSTQNVEKTPRQCAWCLRLIDKTGKRISVLPSPKLYKATHGMCRICALGWMEQVAQAHDVQAGTLWGEIPLSLLAQDPHHAMVFAEHTGAVSV